MDKFLCEFSICKLNLDQDVVVSVQAAKIDRDIFDPVIDVVLTLLETSCLSKFKLYELQGKASVFFFLFFSELSEAAIKKKKSKSPSLTRFFLSVKKTTSQAKLSRESLQFEKVYNLHE
jgi:hypothetical protein